MVEFVGRVIWNICHCIKVYTVYGCIIFLIYIHLSGSGKNTKINNTTKETIYGINNTTRNKECPDDIILEAIKQGNLSWRYLRYTSPTLYYSSCL